MKKTSDLLKIFMACAALLSLPSCDKTSGNGDPENDSIVFSIRETSRNYIVYDAAPNNAEAAYFVNVRPEYQFSVKTEAEIVSEDMESIKGEDGGLDFSKLYHGTLESVKAEGLYSDTQYRIYGFYVDEQGVPSSGFFSKKAYTEKNTGVSCEYAVSVELTGVTSADISISPSDKEISWYWTLATDEELDECDGIAEMFVKNELDASIEYDMSQGMEFRDALLSNVHFGDFYNSLSSLFGSTKYNVLVCAVDYEANIASGIYEYEFESMRVPISGNGFTLDVRNITSSSAVLHIETVNEDPYTFFVSPGGQGYSIEELVDYYIEDNGILMNTGLLDIYKGDYTSSFSGLDPMTEYIVIVFGYEGGRTTSIETVSFVTK